MSLMKTLAKVAIGVAVAKGMKSMSSGGGLLGGAKGASSGGLQDMMGSLLGGGAGQSPRSASSGGADGGLGGLLEQLSGTQSRTRSRTRSTGASAGGLGDILGQLGGSGLAGGGLGSLLGGLATAGAAGGLGGLLGGAQGFGAKLNSSLATQGEPDDAPSASQEALAGLMILAMVQAAKSDGEIDPAEQDRMLGHLGDVSPQETAFVNAALEAPVDVEALAAQVPDGLEAQIYTMSLMAIDLDNQKEAQYLHGLAQALDLGQSEVNRIHAELGAPALYA